MARERFPGIKIFYYDILSVSKTTVSTNDCIGTSESSLYIIQCAGSENF